MLSHYRVLDLTDDGAQLAGHALAQLGAEVISIEPPGGRRSRHVGPFITGLAHPDRSIPHWAYNRGKRSVVLDLDSDSGRNRLRHLAAGADVLIESSVPGMMQQRGLGPDDLLDLNPALIYASLTPFGSDGPRARWRASDLTIMAASSPMSLTGDIDRPPLRLSAPQGTRFAGAAGASAIVLALLDRARTGDRDAFGELVWRLTVAPHTVRPDWIEQLATAGIDAATYVEALSIVSRLTALDTLCFALGAPPAEIPEPVAGAPTGEIATQATIDGGWVPTVGIAWPPSALSPESSIHRSWIAGPVMQSSRSTKCGPSSVQSTFPR